MLRLLLIFFTATKVVKNVEIFHKKNLPLHKL